MKTTTKYCIAAGTTGLVMVALLIADYYAKSGNCFLRFLATIFATASLIFALTGLHHYYGEYRQERKRKSPALTSPVIVWPMTLFLAISIVTACPASELQQTKAQQAAVSSAFKLLSANGDCELTPTNGGPTISFSRDCVKVDKEHMQLITPAGKYKIIPVTGSDSQFLLQDENGVTYTPNMTLCGILLGLAGAAALAGLCVLGYKAYKCGCNVISNYNNKISNASAIYMNPTLAVKAQDVSGPLPFPMLCDLTATGSAIHTFGLPPSMLKLPTGYVMSFDTNSWLIDTNIANTNLFFQDQTIVGNRTDIFGNAVSYRTLIVVNSANSYLVNTNTGIGVPCMIKTSSDLIHWQDMNSVSLSYISSDSSGVHSLTSVMMTPDLVSYATNWYRFDGSGTVVESWSLTTPIGVPMTSQQQFIRLASP